MVCPSVVSSTCDSRSIFKRSKIGRSITIAQLLPCFTSFLIMFTSKNGLPMYHHCDNAIRPRQGFAMIARCKTKLRRQRHRRTAPHSFEQTRSTLHPLARSPARHCWNTALPFRSPDRSIAVRLPRRVLRLATALKNAASMFRRHERDPVVFFCNIDYTVA